MTHRWRVRARFVWAVSVRHAGAHKARLVLSGVGIAAGVTLVVATSVLTASISASLSTVVQAMGTEATIEVRPVFDGGLPGGVLDSVRRVAGVQAAGATVESYTQARGPAGRERVLLVGFDLGMLAMGPRRDADVTLGDLSGLVIPERLASNLGVALGEQIEILTPVGWRPATVGVTVGDAQADRVRVITGPLPTVAELLGRGDRIDAVYVAAPASILGAVQEAAGPAAMAGPPGVRQEHLRELVDPALLALSVASVIALFVGGFLVYNTMSMAAVERVREAAMLRAMGALRRQTTALFMIEGGVLGIGGSIAGVGAGVLFARRVMQARGSPLEELLPVDLTTVAIRPGLVGLAMAVGIAASLVAAALPARRIARADPALAIGSRGHLNDPTVPSRTKSMWLGIVLVVVGSVASFWGLTGGMRIVAPAIGGLVIAMLGMALALPALGPVLAGAGLQRLSRARRVPGLVRIAAGEILRSPGRTAFTVGGVVLALSLVVGIGISQASISDRFMRNAGEIFRADLYVNTGTNRPYGVDMPLDAQLASRIEESPGVLFAYPFANLLATIHGRTIVVNAYDLQAYARLPGLDGDRRARAHREAAVGTQPMTALASRSLISQFGLRVGEEVELPTPTGVHHLRIGGIAETVGGNVPELFLHYETFVALWGRAVATTFPVALEPGVDQYAVREEMQGRLGPEFSVWVHTRDEFVAWVEWLVSSVTRFVQSIHLVALVIAGLGIANALLMSVVERRRDLAVLRAIGMRRRDIRRMVGAQGMLIGVVGTGLGFLGGIGAGVIINTAVRAAFSLEVSHVFPPATFATAAVVGIGGAVVASMLPAYRGAGTDVATAVHYE